MYLEIYGGHHVMSAMHTGSDAFDDDNQESKQFEEEDNDKNVYEADNEDLDNIDLAKVVIDPTNVTQRNCYIQCIHLQ